MASPTTSERHFNKQVSRSKTAEIVCAMRAAETLRPPGRRIIDDPYAKHFLTNGRYRLLTANRLTAALSRMEVVDARLGLVAHATPLASDRNVPQRVRGDGIPGLPAPSRTFAVSRMLSPALLGGIGTLRDADRAVSGSRVASRSAVPPPAPAPSKVAVSVTSMSVPAPARCCGR